MVRTKKQDNEKPVWLKYTTEEVEAIIVKLAKKGLTSEKIGLVLRDQYGIPKAKLFNIKIKKIMEKHGEFIEPTNTNLKIKLDKIIKHIHRNRQDKKAGRSLIITKAKLKKREDYNLAKLK